MDLDRLLTRLLAPSIRRGTTPRMRASMGLSGGSGGPSPGIVSSSRGLLPVPVGVVATGLGAALNVASRAAVIPSLIETTEKVFNPKDNIITSLQNFGTSVENQFVAPGGERRYIGSNPVAVAANRRLDSRRPLNAIETGKYGPTDWNPSANPFASAPTAPTLPPPPAPTLPPPTDGAAQRNYEAEKQRVAQMTEQDPLFKKYRVAELTKAYNTASPEDKEKIGLEIWATTNPELAQKLKPGQLGYTQAVSAFQSQSPLGAITKAAGDVQYADLLNKPFSVPMDPGGVPLGFSPAQLQTPLTGVEIPSTDKIGVKEFFSDIKPAPGAMEAFTNPLKLFSPEDLSETKQALLKQAFASRIK